MAYKSPFKKGYVLRLLHIPDGDEYHEQQIIEFSFDKGDRFRTIAEFRQMQMEIEDAITFYESLGK